MNIILSIRRSHRLFAVVLAAALVLSYLPAQATPAAQAGQYTVGDCRGIDQEQLRDEIERHVLTTVVNGTAPLAIDSIVARKWAELDMDSAVDAAVAQATGNLAAQEGYLDKFISGWWGEKAQEYAERIANDAFSSPEFRARLDLLAQAIGAEVARQVESQFAQAASVALLCLQEYVGEQYSRVLFDAFQRNVRTDIAAVDLTVETGPVMAAADQHSLAIAGVGTILVTQLTYRLAQKLSEKIAQRVAGKVVGRILGKAGSSFIPVAGWIIGIAMIAYDLWEGTEGALPQIQEALTSEEVKAKIRDEIAVAIKDDLPDQATLIALETAVSLVDQWQGFCTAYADICTVADKDLNFRSLLGLVGLDELDDLAALVTWFQDEAGQAALQRAVEDGTLETLLALPATTTAGLITASRPAVALAWLDLAGARLPEVVALGVHQYADPTTIDRASLAALLTLEDPDAIQRLLALAPAERDALLALPPAQLDQLLAVSAGGDLSAAAAAILQPGTTAPGQTVGAAAPVPAVPASGPQSGANQEAAAEPIAATSAPEANQSTSSRYDGAAGLQPTATDDTMLTPILLAVLLLLGSGGVAGYTYWRRRQVGGR